MFEVNIRFIGGLLAAYYLSGQEVSAPEWHVARGKRERWMETRLLVHVFLISWLYTSRQVLAVVFNRDAVSSDASLFGLFGLFFSVRSVYSGLHSEPSGFFPPGANASRRQVHSTVTVELEKKNI